MLNRITTNKWPFIPQDKLHHYRLQVVMPLVTKKIKKIFSDVNTLVKAESCLTPL